MWIIVVVALALLAFLAVWLGFVPPPHSVTLIRFENGDLYLRKGQLRNYAREQIIEMLNEAKVPRGFIAVTPGDSVMFSRGIPARLHQRLRNVLLNQSS
jgi:hypothetical protein